MDFTILFSTRVLESTFSNILIDRLTGELSEFNRQQLNVLIEKHKSLYCLFIACEVCDYLLGKGNNSKNYANTLWNINANYRSDLSSFITRFLKWSNEEIEELFNWIENILRNLVLTTLINITGEDVHDNRKFDLREYDNISLQNTISGERVLSLKYRRKDVSFVGYGVGI